MLWQHYWLSISHMCIVEQKAPAGFLSLNTSLCCIAMLPSICPVAAGYGNGRSCLAGRSDRKASTMTEQDLHGLIDDVRRGRMSRRTFTSSRRCSSRPMWRTRILTATSGPICRRAQRRCSSRIIPASSCGSSCQARSRATRTSIRAGNVARWKSPEYDNLFAQREVEIDPVKRATMFIALNDMLIKNVVVIPVATRPCVGAVVNNLHASLSGWDTNT